MIHVFQEAFGGKTGDVVLSSVFPSAACVVLVQGNLSTTMPRQSLTVTLSSNRTAVLSCSSSYGAPPLALSWQRTTSGASSLTSSPIPLVASISYGSQAFLAIKGSLANEVSDTFQCVGHQQSTGLKDQQSSVFKVTKLGENNVSFRIMNISRVCHRC